MPDKDKPTVHFSHSQLKAEAVKPDPFVYVTASGKRVTFPDIYDMDADEAESYLDDVTNGLASMKSRPVLEKWLGSDQMAKLDEEKFSLRELLILVKHAQGYYESVWADLGEGDGSAN